MTLEPSAEREPFLKGFLYSTGFKRGKWSLAADTSGNASAASPRPSSAGLPAYLDGLAQPIRPF